MAAPQISFDEDQADNSGTVAPGDGAAAEAAGGAGQAAEAAAANAAANVQSGAGNRNSANANQFNVNMPQGPPPTVSWIDNQKTRKRIVVQCMEEKKNYNIISLICLGNGNRIFLPWRGN